MPYKDADKQREAMRSWRVENPDYQEQWREDNPEYHQEYWTRRNDERKASEAERKRLWYQANKERKAEAQRVYRERKRQEAMEQALKNNEG